MKLFWLIAAGTCIVIAAVLLLMGKLDAAFVVAVLGIVSWFLNYRAQVSRQLDEQDQQEQNDQEGDNYDDENSDSQK